MAFGRISFSFYLVHYVLHYVLLKVELWQSQTTFADSSLTVRILLLVSAACACLFLAVITYYAVELPLQRHARAILRRNRDVFPATVVSVKTI
jgi:peptidoglycan/LPS O-acetylase OafA/YrhL